MNFKTILIKTLKYISLLFWALIMILPILTIIFGSFKTSIEFNQSSGISLPNSFLNFENYKIVFETGKLSLGFINTFIIVLLGVGGSIIVGSMVAFVLSRFQFKYKKIILFLYLFISIIPLEISQVSTFKIINALGLYNTRLAAVLIYIGADVLMLYIYLQMFEKIPKEIDKAALLEGASYFQLYKNIIFPLLKPATATVCMLKTIAIYNDFYIPFLYMPGEKLKTISTTLFSYIGPELTQWHIICAAIVISTIPMIIFFLFLQKYIYTGITAGSIK